MTEPKNKSEILSETCKSHLTDKYVSAKYGRETHIENRYITKGLMVEEDSITLFSRANKKYFAKNEQQLTNEFISGTPDLFIGKSIREAEVIIDLKSSWDIFTFFRTTQEKLNSNYFYQLQGYMGLTGAKSATLAYCLVNTPGVLIEDEKRKLLWKMGAIDSSPEFMEAADKIDKLSIYDDVPLSERINEIVIRRDEDAINRIYERVKECRKYMDRVFFKDMAAEVKTAIESGTTSVKKEKLQVK